MYNSYINFFRIFFLYLLIFIDILSYFIFFNEAIKIFFKFEYQFSLYKFVIIRF